MNQTSSQRKSKKGIILGLIILLLLVILIIVLIFIFRNKDKMEPKPIVQVQPYVFSDMAHSFDISGNEEEYPLFRGITIDPFYGMAGNTQRISITAQEMENFIASAYASVLDDNGSQTINLSLASRVDNLVTWQGEWTIRAISTRDYPITFVAVDKSGNSKQIDIFWTGQSSMPVSVKTPGILERIKNIFSIQTAKAEFINTQSGTINSNQFPHSGDITINSSVAFGPGIGNTPYVTGVDGGNVIIPYGKTLELKANTYFFINPGYQMLKQNGGYLAVAQDGKANVYSGYLWAKDSDNDKCFDVSTLKYNQSANVPDAGWGTGYKRVADLEYYPEPDDQNAGTAPACTGSSFNLKVTKLGSGNGTITSIYPSLGVSCGSVCDVSFDAGTTVTLKAEKDSTSSFVGWTGDCKNIIQGTGNVEDCVVDMNGNKEVKASFDRTSGMVEVIKSGTGTGKVTSDPTGISCGSICEVSFPLNNTVKLTATPDSGSSFAGWYNDCTGTGVCSLNIQGNKEVEAKFNLGGTTSYKLTVNKTGSGEVKSDNIAGIDCGSDCINYYSPNAVVKLIATPSAGATFLGWADACASTGLNTTCSVTMSAAKTATANFSASTVYALNVERLGSGIGSVTSYPAGINCGPDCTNEYISGLEVTLTPSVDANNVFAGWEGCTNLSGNTCKVLMTSPRTVKATFAPAGNAINIQKTGNGTGTVTSTDGKINCGSDCAETYLTNTLISLNASSMVGSSFVGWAGIDSCTTNTSCTFNVTSGKNITAIFSTTIPTNYTLVVSNSGNGRVTSTPSGTIDCGSVCSANLSPNSVITLTASPNTGYVFSGWSGACTGTTTCNITMDNSKVVNAAFASSVSQYQLNVTKSGTGTGTVASNSPTAAGIICGADCIEAYASGAIVTLTYTTDQNSVFAGWTGACTGSGSTCTVVMNEAKTVMATFNSQSSTAYTLSVGVSGSGTVTSSPAGLTCYSTVCHQTFPAGTSVTLTATPDTAAAFGGWDDDCSGTGNCTFVMDGNKGVTARFSTASYSLTVTKTGEGAGSIISSVPAGAINMSCVSCGQTKLLAKNIAVTLFATPLENSTFVGWSGACNTTTPSCSLIMDGPKDVAGEFTSAVKTLTIITEGDGYGVVKSSTGDIECGKDIWWGDKTNCTKTYETTTSVTLTATKGVGSIFVGWTGACTGTETTCTVSVDSAKTVTANFDMSDIYKVTVSKTGSGKVTGPGIDCGTDCESEWVSGTSITLKATPDSGSTFTEWSGDCTGSSTSCTLTMDSIKGVEALFTSNTSATVSGSGTIKLPDCSVSVGAGVWAKNLNNTPSSSYMCKMNTSCSKSTPCQLLGFVHSVKTGASGTAYSETYFANTLTGLCIPSLFTIYPAGTELCLGQGSGSTLTYLPACSFTGVIGTVYAKDESCSWDYKCELNTACSKVCSLVHALKTYQGYYAAYCGFGNCSYCVVTSGTSTSGSGNGTSTPPTTPTSYKLTVSKSGSGSGTIKTSDGKINCGSTCWADYDPNATVSLTATASTGSAFVRWSGACVGSAVCTVTMSAAKTVYAEFALNTSTYTLNVYKSGSGTVTSSPTGISCGSDCSHTYNLGTIVKLTAVPASGYAFGGWSGWSAGDCLTYSTTCNIPMDANRTQTATFNPVESGGGSANFIVSVYDATITVTKPSSGTKEAYSGADMAWTAGGDRTVSWTSTNVPSGVTITITPSSCTSSCGPAIKVAVSSSATKGTYTVGIKATNSTGSKTATFTLIIK